MVNLTIRPQAKQVQYFTEQLPGNIGLDMVLIPSGTFEMGSPPDEPGRKDCEGPQHTVNVPQFCMGRYPVTQAQWKAIASLPEQNQKLNPDPSNIKGDQRPVEQVSWYDAREFCARLTLYTKRTYQLSSEAEWEYACRAGTTTPFYFGQIITTDLVNYNGKYTYNGGPEGKARKETTPVGAFKYANAFGLCDMHGNVYEWCEDHYHDSYEGAPLDGSAWIDQEAKESGRRVVRGGSWYYGSVSCRSAYRSYDIPRVTDFVIGFRVVCRLFRSLP